MADFNDLSQVFDLFSLYKGRILGVIIGLIAALLIIRFGFILALFIIICMGIGYYLGLRYDNREDFRDIIDDIFPNE